MRNGTKLQSSVYSAIMQKQSGCAQATNKLSGDFRLPFTFYTHKTPKVDWEVYASQAFKPDMYYTIFGIKQAILTN